MPLTDTVNFVFTFVAMIRKTNLPSLLLKIQQTATFAEAGISRLTFI
jgi:hypothetical protein